MTNRVVQDNDVKFRKDIVDRLRALEAEVVAGVSSGGGGGGGPVALGGVLSGFSNAASFSEDMATQDELDDVSTAVAGKSPIGHVHDDRYYTEAELDAMIGSFAAEGFDTSPIGSIIAWPNRSLPSAEWLHCDGASKTQAAYPQLYDIAVAEVAAGNPLWTVDTVAHTFTVPNLNDKFLVAKGANAVGVTGGAASVAITAAQMPAHRHDHDGQIGQTHPNEAGDNNDKFQIGWGGAGRQTPGTQTQDYGGNQAHENRPPFATVGFIIKALGVTISGATIQGPPGAAGAPGSQGGITMATIPSCQLKHSTTQTPAQGGPLTFDTEIWDTDNMHDATNPGRITCRTPGIYVASLSQSWSSHSVTEYREIGLVHKGPTGTTIRRSFQLSPPTSPNALAELQVAAQFQMSAGDYIETYVSDSSGVNQVAANDYSPVFTASWLGEGRGVVGAQSAPTAVLTHSTTQPINDDGGFTALSFNTKTLDTDGMLNTANVITINTPGVYTVVFSWLQASGAGERYAKINVNGTEVNRTHVPAYANDVCGAPVVWTGFLSAGDVVSALAGSYQKGSASSLNSTPYTRFSATMNSRGKAVIPLANVSNSAVQTVASGATVVPAFNTAAANNDAMWSAGNPTRLVCNTAGVYVVTLAAYLTASLGSGRYQIGLRKNSSSFIGIGNISPGAAETNATAIVELGVGDYVDVRLLNGDSVSRDAFLTLAATKIGLSGQAGVSNTANWALSGNDLVSTVTGKVKATDAFVGKAIAFRAHNAAVTAVGAGTKMALTAEDFDSHLWYDAPNSRFQPQQAGYYNVTVRIVSNVVLAVGNVIEARIHKNGAFYDANRSQVANAVSGVYVEVNEIVFMNGSTDYLEAFAYQDSGSNKDCGGRFMARFIGTQ